MSKGIKAKKNDFAVNSEFDKRDYMGFEINDPKDLTVHHVYDKNDIKEIDDKALKHELRKKTVFLLQFSHRILHSYIEKYNHELYLKWRIFFDETLSDTDVYYDRLEVQKRLKYETMCTLCSLYDLKKRHISYKELEKTTYDKYLNYINGDIRINYNHEMTDWMGDTIKGNPIGNIIIYKAEYGNESFDLIPLTKADVELITFIKKNYPAIYNSWTIAFRKLRRNNGVMTPEVEKDISLLKYISLEKMNYVPTKRKKLKPHSEKYGRKNTPYKREKYRKVIY